MAFVPSNYTPVRQKSDIRWFSNGEEGDELVLNRPIDDLANMVLTVVNESSATKKSVRLSSDANIVYAEYTSSTLKGLKNTAVISASIINTSTVVTVASGVTNSITVGASITGTGIQAATTVAAINSLTEFVISKPATTTNASASLTYSQTLSLLYIDGVRPAANDRVLIKDQSTQTLNGIYTVIEPGTSTVQWSLLRSDDATTWNQFPSSIVATDEGVSNADSVWFCTVNKNAGTVGANNISYQGLGGSGQMLGKAKVRVFSYNAQVLDENIVVPANYNGSAVGPITIADGVSLTIEDGARIVIL